MRTKRWTILVGSIILLVGAFMVCQTTDIRHVRTDECPICRAQHVKVYFANINIKDTTNENTFSQWYRSLDPNHIHTWIPRARMGYNAFGTVRSSAHLTEYRVFSIDPKDEREALSTDFTSNEALVIASRIRETVPGNALFFALYGDGTNAQKNLNDLRAWLHTVGMPAGKTN